MGQKLWSEQRDTQTDRQTDSSANITYPHTRMVK